MNPTNITLLDPKKIVPGVFKPIITTDTFEGMTQNLNDEGLFSVEIFGRMGSKERDQIESYIQTKLFIFNPTYFKALVQIKSLYLGIMKGTEYAVWDNSVKDFIKSNILDGQTGYSFFIQHFKDIVLTTTDSYKRKQRVTLLERFKDISLTNKVLVVPAGLRDIQFEPSGAVTEPELNELYRKLMFKTRVIAGGDLDNAESSLYDTVRWGLQVAFNDIDDYLFDLFDGKGGLYQKKVATRGVVAGTRNVITARKVNRSNLRELNGVDPNSTDIGLLQSLLAYQYVCVNAIVNKYIEDIFTPGSQTAKLVNKKTLEYEYVEVSSEIVEKWTTATGLGKLFNGFANASVRNRPILVKGYYLALVYDDGKDVCVLGDIGDLPKGKDRKNVKPMTYAELFYLSCHKVIEDQMGQATRYPVTGVGSIFPTNINLLTTTNAKKRNVVDTEWETLEVCNRFPESIKGEGYFDAMSVDPSREAGLGSDSLNR